MQFNLTKHFYIAILFIFLIWVGFFVFFYLKADEITKDPCRICSERMGKEVVCRTTTFIPSTRVYYPNGTVVTENPKVNLEEKKMDLSKYLKSNST